VADLRGHTVKTGLFIAGAWEDTQKKYAVTNPADESTIAHMSDGTPADALRALDASVAASHDWRFWAPRARADLFHRTHALLMERADAFADVMVLESGKPRAEAMAEFNLSAGFFLWYTEQIAHLHGTYAEGSPGGYRVI
jgi:succinate-semialdehyde dehydrogenase/glutarate-semialdehyde dehydrogenase